MKSMHALCVLVLCLQPSLLLGQVNITSVAVTGDAAPGGGTYTSFLKHDFVLNAAGQVGFGGQVQGAQGVFLYSGPVHTLVARSGSQAPGMPAGVNYLGFADLALGSSGQMAISGNADNNQGAVWSGIPGALQLVARQGDPAPGISPPQNYASYFSNLAINGAGVVAFHQGDTSTNSPDRRSIWMGQPGSIQLLATDNANAPGTTKTFFDVTFPFISESGKVAFYAVLNPFVPTNGGDTGLWMGTPGAVQLVATSGAVAPGTGGLKFDQGGFHYPAVNDSGQIVFHGALDGTGDNEGIWLGTPGSLQLVMRDGQNAPGTAGTFEGSWRPELNDSGRIVFQGTVGGWRGIWRGDASSLQLVAIENTAAPGVGSGVMISSMGLGHQISNTGQVVFDAGLSINGPENRPSLAIFMTDLDGDVLLVAREGGFLNVGGDMKQIQELILRSNIFDGHVSDSGQVAFYAAFTDGSSGIFLASVPEPSSIFVILGPLLWLSGRRMKSGQRV